MPSCSRSPSPPARARWRPSTGSWTEPAASSSATCGGCSPRCAPARPWRAAFDAYAARSGLPAVSRFAEGVAIAVERGTPLAEVLHAQAGDVREASRRALIESGARREVLMMVPVVFLVLPTVVIFAFWPGIVGLRLVVP